MARWEVTDYEADVHKFWELRVRGASVELRYGRIGTRGQTRTKAFASDAEARQNAVSMFQKKEKAGYRYIEGSGPRPSAEAAPAARAAIDPVLLDALRAEPDSAEAHLVFSDFLLAQGDPLGELVSLGVAMHDERDPGRFMPLQARRDALLEAQQRHLFGPLADVGSDVVRLRWRLGLVRDVTVRFAEPADRMRVALEAVGRAPVCVLLRRLEIEAASVPKVAEGLVKLELPSTTDTLVLWNEGWGGTEASLRRTFEVVATKASLRNLVLEAGVVGWPCPQIEHLTVREARLAGRAPWPAVHTLRVEAQSLDELPPLEDVLPNLKRLEVVTTHDLASRDRLLERVAGCGPLTVEIAGETLPGVADAWRATEHEGLRVELTARERG